MTASTDTLILNNRHTGEHLELRRVSDGGQSCFALKGSMPPNRQGPPLHVHFSEAEEFHVVSGTLSAVADGRELRLRAGESAVLAPGSVHRWWNDGDETLVIDGFVRPAADLDRYLQALFDVLNAGAPDRPSLFYMAHVVERHRRTQGAVFIPAPIRTFVFPLIVLIGTLLGRYRGSGWPGSPERCPGVPTTAAT